MTKPHLYLDIDHTIINTIGYTKDNVPAGYLPVEAPDYAYIGNEPRYVAILEGVADEVIGLEETYEVHWATLWDSYASRFNELLTVAWPIIPMEQYGGINRIREPVDKAWSIAKYRFDNQITRPFVWVDDCSQGVETEWPVLASLMGGYLFKPSAWSGGLTLDEFYTLHVISRSFDRFERIQANLESRY